MKVYTVQLAKRQQAIAQGIPVFDVTVKSGHIAFAPTWNMVKGHKSGQMKVSAYTRRYLAMMRQSYVDNHQAWMGLVEMPTVAIACYCRAGKFCHRHLLVDYLEKVCQTNGIPFERGGEID